MHSIQDSFHNFSEENRETNHRERDRGMASSSGASAFAGEYDGDWGRLIVVLSSVVLACLQGCRLLLQLSIGRGLFFRDGLCAGVLQGALSLMWNAEWRHCAVCCRGVLPLWRSRSVAVLYNFSCPFSLVVCLSFYLSLTLVV